MRKKVCKKLKEVVGLKGVKKEKKYHVLDNGQVIDISLNGTYRTAKRNYTNNLVFRNNIKNKRYPI